MYNQKRRFLAFLFFRNVNTIAKNLGQGFSHYIDRCDMLLSSLSPIKETNGYCIQLNLISLLLLVCFSFLSVFVLLLFLLIYLSVCFYVGLFICYIVVNNSSSKLTCCNVWFSLRHKPEHKHKGNFS